MSTARGKPKRAEKRVEEKVELDEKILLRTTVDIGSLLRHVINEVEKGNVKYYTPYTLAQSLNVKISDAKRVLREAVKQGILKLHSGGRRSPIYVPATHTTAQHEAKTK